MNVIAIIPARYASTRFPGKPLARLKGKPLIQYVYERVQNTGLFTSVCVATDNLTILEAVQSCGGRAVLTKENHLSGSDRIAEALQYFPEAELVINVQGDEPLIEKEPLQKLIAVFEDSQVQMASLITTFTDSELLNNPNIVKVVTDRQNNALYFSRSAIPFNRDNLSDVTYYRHIGVYAYLPDCLQKFVALKQGELEKIENLEQLRALENGISIKMVETNYQGIGIDTPADLATVEKLLS
ncbi:MAG: 3-deoxy-manno-octulosonate cytidylyltransferase [Candidatus Cloacimonas sp.]